MTAMQIRVPEKLRPVFEGRADVRGAYGGRGSAKTRTFAKMIAAFGMAFGMQGVSGQLLCAREYMNSLDDSSIEECKRAIEEEPQLAAYYDVGEKYIKSRDGRIDFTFAGLNRSLGSIKSKGRILICWVDEAEPITETAWQILEPTLREEGAGWNAELWVTWNPSRKTAAVEKRYRFTKDPLAKVVSMNWRDNPWFPALLERKRQRCIAETPDDYDHVWEGGYKTAVEGAYFAKQLAEAKAQGRIARVGPDPLMTLRAMVDIGGTGAKADSFVIWIKQFVAREVRVLDYYEAQGQPLATHLAWMRARNYGPERCQFWLPHDGATHDKVFDVSYESSLEDAGYTVTVVPNQGKGAAAARIEAARRVFPMVWFNNGPSLDATLQPIEDATAAGREALAWYHEKKDEDRSIGLGPEHDWASHGADAFGLGCVVYEVPKEKSKPLKINRKFVR